MENINKKTIIVASANKGKLKEISEMLSEYNVIGYKSLGLDFEIEETGTTFYENAKIKATAVMQATGHAVLADDSGLCVDALNGAPGIYSARYSEDGTDENNNKLLLENLKNVATEQRTAKFVCCMVMVFPNGKEIFAEGETKGIIAEYPQGENGFGYDPLFISSDLNKCLGVASPQEKNTISHRSRALNKLIKLLREYEK